MSARPHDTPVAASEYDVDFYEWTRIQARLIREGRFDRVDLENVAEEIESIGRSDWHAVRSLTEQVLVHLCCLARSPSEAPRQHWRIEVLAFRARLQDLLDDSPSLRRKLGEKFDQSWLRARRLALIKLEADGVRELPEACPFTFAELLDLDFVPAAPAGDGV